VELEAALNIRLVEERAPTLVADLSYVFPIKYIECCFQGVLDCLYALSHGPRRRSWSNSPEVTGITKVLWRFLVFKPADVGGASGVRA